MSVRQSWIIVASDRLMSLCWRHRWPVLFNRSSFQPPDRSNASPLRYERYGLRPIDVYCCWSEPILICFFPKRALFLLRPWKLSGKSVLPRELCFDATVIEAHLDGLGLRGVDATWHILDAVVFLRPANQ